MTTTATAYREGEERADAHLVLLRKSRRRSAVGYSTRTTKRQNAAHVVLDLKPDCYPLTFVELQEVSAGNHIHIEVAAEGMAA